MDIQGLKDKILQLAIQGKLVDQDKNDEPASVLVERIKEERDKLVKEGKIKKQKSLPKITEEEKPFEIPEGWEWVRLERVYRFIDYRGKTPNKIDEGVPLITAKNVKKGYIDYSIREYISVEEFEQRKTRGISKEGDILFTTEAPMGNVAIADLGIYSAGQRIITLQQYTKENILYNKMFMYFIMSNAFQNQLLENKTGTTVSGIKASKLKNTLLPLPPLAEQKRIVEKVDQLFALIDELNSNKEDLLEVINLTRNQVLQEAIQGKLVEQNPEDEPASVLIQRIKEERDKLVKEGKIRKEKPLSEITEEEKPFEIPEGWEWIRLGEVIQLISGRDEPVSDCNDEGRGLPYIMGASNIEDEKLLIERWIVNPRVIAKKHDLILTVKGTVGKMIILKEYEEVNLSRQVVALRQISNMYSDYLYWFIKSHINVINNKSQGVIPGISRSDILEIIFPLPPLAEQKLIVEKLDNIMNMLDALEKTII